jgi:hypothetical protein
VGAKFESLPRRSKSAAKEANDHDHAAKKGEHFTEFAHGAR